MFKSIVLFLFDPSQTPIYILLVIIFSIEVGVMNRIIYIYIHTHTQ